MKKLDLNGLGVQEMNVEESILQNGGSMAALAISGGVGAALAIIGGAILVGCVVEEITEGPTKCWNDFMKGYNSMR